MMEIIAKAFQYGQFAQRQGDAGNAIIHYTRALEVFHSAFGSHYDPTLWAKILFARAECYLFCQQYHSVESDLRQALIACPQPVFQPEKAHLWLQYGSRSDIPPQTTVSCCEVALHFAAGDSNLQSDIYRIKALAHYNLGDEPKCEQDAEVSKILDINPTLETGMRVKSQGMEKFRLKQYEDAARYLQLAEIFVRPTDPDKVSSVIKQNWYDCWKFIMTAAWRGKKYVKAIQAGKRWRQLQQVTCEDEATRWKENGNEIFREEKFDLAIDCYSLSIQYASVDNLQLLGTLHSNRSQAYFKKKQFKKAKDDAEKCFEYRPNWSKSFYRLGSALIELKMNERALEILKKGLSIKQVFDDRYEIFKKIMSLTFNSEGGPAKVTFELPRDCLSRYLKECVEKHYWKSLQVFLLGGGGHQSFAEGEGGIATGNCDLKDISLCDVLKADPKPNMYYELINALIDHGTLVNGCNEQDNPLVFALNHDDHDLAVFLLKKNANSENLLKSKFGKQDDTPIHTAFRIGLTLGHWQIFVHLMENTECSANTTTSNPETLNKKGNSLYHLVASGGVWHHVAEGIDHLREYKIDPLTRNKDGKTPLMMIRQNSDPRYRLIDESVKIFAPDNTKKKKKRKNKNKSNAKINIPTSSKSKKDEEVNNQVMPVVHELPAPSVRCPTEIESLRKKVSQAIQHFEIKTETEMKESECDEVKETSEIDQSFATGSNETISPEQMIVKESSTMKDLAPDKEPIPPHTLDADPQDVEVSDDEDCGVDEDTFDNLTWEVECTSDVQKKLKDKKLPSDKKRQIVRIIKQLANGQMRGSYAKRLVGIAKESDILLFEAKLDKSARILWERAIAFSPRCSALPDNQNNTSSGIYTEVIRIWDIVFDHDTVPRKIKKIIRSYNRGTSCSIKKNLKATPIDASLSKNLDRECVPKIYVPKDADPLAEENKKPYRSNETSKMFFPPGSPEETEYHILKFYAFSNAMVTAMLDNQNQTHFDFPFRVSELEHSVINLALERATSILLLGRSGTGKTTCCLYRLWNNYQTYWLRNKLDEPSIPNVAQFIPRESDIVADDEGGNEASACEERRSTSSHEATQEYQGCSSSDVQQGCSSSMEHPKQSRAMGEGGKQEASCQSDEDEDSQAGGKEQTLEHLHQAFITKNAVLCKEVQKNFMELSHACFPTRNDVDHEQSSPVYKFDQLEEQAWPLFICSRDWLLMLDASLPGKPFFQRNEDGKLERTVKGWAKEDNNLQEIPVDYSDDEDDDEDEGESKPAVADGERIEQQPEGERDPRREITYQVFKNELWRKMTKKKKVDYHSSLVWTEIISFIKGSVEALHSEDGYITLEEYQTIGRKRAPSFTADRETIYELFKAYQRIRRTHGMFDEADVVHHIYHRLEHHVPSWSIHEIYVDETQDFTQAELSVIIRSCRNPNRLFFTGDTAQSIMRGIAFRFSDLRSLFHYMKESFKAVGQDAEVVVPDRVYELTHNYRSHAGILNLASSVTDLLSHFFPESFDKLARDQGLFEGPKPVLLESCSFSDLAVILRGHKRKTSPIEFGAHQVILVTSDEVRESLPEELSLALVMTIYEAKGLEFDDVLIYNFFKDSQALKEWRVVGTYTEKEDEDTNVSATGIAEIQVDQLECKARPLEFNPDQHKILISEFKYLYTAVTRARVNVWLFDECEEARAPMFEYFQKRGVVDVKQVQKTEGDVTSLQGMFAQKSEKEDWKKQGLFFYGKGLWKVASKCFAMADEEMWMKKCNAHDQAAKAATLRSEPRKLRLEFLKAADLFLECGMDSEAKTCLFNARERILLAKLHEKSKSFLKAAKIFQNEGKFHDAARNFESSRDFERAVDCLLKVNRYNEVLDLISRYNDLIENGEENTILKPPRYDQRDESICYQAAKYYKRRGNHGLMSHALERLPKIEDRITFLKKNGFFDEAAELLLKEGRAQEAARLMRSKGKFLEAARYSDDKSFIADCYLLAARSSVQNMKTEFRNKESEELIDGLFERAMEMYEKCENLNGQAEVLFARGKFYKNSKYVDGAAKFYRQTRNYAAVTDCYFLLMNNDPERMSRPKTKDTLHGLLHLILALHKENRENSERTAVTMCYTYFGLEDTDDVYTKKVPHLEMVKFSNLQNGTTKSDSDEVISVREGDRLIKDHLHKMAHKLIERVWKEEKQIIDRSKPCSQFIVGITCDNTTCNHHHEKLSRTHFINRFHALLFLVHVEDRIATFLKSMKRESAKVKNHLQQLLFIEPEFTACRWLYELLFPRDGELVSSYFLSDGDVSFLRRQVSDRIIEFAKKFLWGGSIEEERWSSSDLFIEVSNLVHIAGAPARNLYDLLAVEEKKFESRNLKDHPGMFFDRNSGRYHIFSKSLERSKSRLYWNGDVLGSVQAAVKKFLFASAKIKALPYPSIANVVMILERHLTACLLLYTRLMMNETIVCLPESYLSMVNFWDFVDRPRTNRNASLYGAIQTSSQFTQGRDNFSRLFELTWDIVALTFGEIWWRYNIVKDALCDDSINWVEVERVLVLVLTMLCNCGRGIPEKCEKLIREHLHALQLRQDLPEKLKKCVEGVRSATGIQDVIRCLEELLTQKHRQERLCDVKWDDYKAKDLRMNCKFYRYSEQFLCEIDVNEVSNIAERKQREEQEAEEEMTDNYPQVLDEHESHSQRREYSEEERENALFVMARALLEWKHRKDSKAKSEEMIRNDPVESHFQHFKLDKSGCTICGSVQFVDRGSNITDATSADPSSSLEGEGEERASTWRILQRNTFETHCSRKSPHWKKDKSFREFKKFYKKLIQPTIDRATELTNEMTKLSEETEVDCSLDLDRLNDEMSRLNNKIKKVEDERTWDSVHLIRKAAEKVKSATKQIKDTKGRRGGFTARQHGANEESDDDFVDDGLDDHTVGHLKDVSNKGRGKSGKTKNRRR